MNEKRKSAALLRKDGTQRLVRQVLACPSGRVRIHRRMHSTWDASGDNIGSHSRAPYLQYTLAVLTGSWQAVYRSRRGDVYGSVSVHGDAGIRQ
jgi:uncharacterized membrane protein